MARSKSKANARRGILCPRCDQQFEISLATKSIMCPGCNRNLQTEDQKIKAYCAVQELFVEGKVEVAKRGHVIADVRVRALLVAGEVKGPVKAREHVRIEKTGKIFGNITTPALEVKDGASLVGYCVVGVPPDIAEKAEKEAPAPAPLPIPEPVPVVEKTPVKSAPVRADAPVKAEPPRRADAPVKAAPARDGKKRKMVTAKKVTGHGVTKKKTPAAKRKKRRHVTAR